jgi:asparagine synthase (glutamine-hydrolysing)
VARQRLPGGPPVVSARELLQAGDWSSRANFEAHRNLNQRLANDVLRYSTPNLLRYEDKNSMAFSIEARVPFLDHEMVEFIFSLPIDQKIKGGWNRAVYRNAMRGRMPESSRTRRSKIGFTNPDITWMKAKAAEIRAIFASPELAGRELFDRTALVRAWDEYLAGRPGDGLIFWRILVSELWMRRYVDQPVAVAVA